MGLFNKRKQNGGFMDVIRCDEPSYLIWKWHPSGVEVGNNKRENSIRWGSSLRVKDGEVAVFVYRSSNGAMQDYIEGPFDERLHTRNLPVLTSILGLAFEGDTPFQAEVYFINLAKAIQVKFVVPYFDIFDKKFEDFGIPVAVRGTLTFNIQDYREFIKFHRLISFTLDDLYSEIKDATIRHIKTVVGRVPSEYSIPVLQIESRSSEISDLLTNTLSEHLLTTFGINVVSVDIGSIDIDKDSEEYSNLIEVTKDVVGATTVARVEAQIKDIHERQAIEAENYAETLRIQREEGQYAQHKSTETANIGAYQIEKQAEVGIAGAKALGEMNANGAGNIDVSGGAGFNMAAIMTQMAIGGAIGQNIAGNMNNMMSGVNNTSQTTPPPIPQISFYVAVNGQANGPYNMDVLTQMRNSGQLTQDTLVWQDGMTNWQRAGSVPGLQALFPNIPPIPTP